MFALNTLLLFLFYEYKIIGTRSCILLVCHFSHFLSSFHISILNSFHLIISSFLKWSLQLWCRGGPAIWKKELPFASTFLSKQIFVGRKLSKYSCDFSFFFFLVSLPFTMFCLSRFYWLPFIRNFMIALYSLIKSSMATFSNLLMPIFFILSLSLSMPTKILKGYIFLIFPLHAVFVLFVCTLI